MGRFRFKSASIMYYYRLISSMLKAVISTLGTGLYAVYKATSILTTLNTNIFGVYNGDNVNDTSGNALNGTNVGDVTFTTGKIGNAFTFNGSNYVALPNSSFDFTGDFSISTWVKIPSAPVSAVGSIFRNDNYDVATSYGYGLYVNTNRTIGFYIGSTNGTSTVTSTTVLTLNTWYHVTVKRDSVAKRSDLYINGVFEAQATNTNLTIGYGTRAIQPAIGAYRQNNQGVLGTYGYLNGQVDALTIWDKKLSDNEVMALYNGSAGLEYPFSTSITIDSANDSLNTYNGIARGGLTYSAGKSGNAFTFNGTTAYVELPNNMFNFAGDFSISTWLYFPPDIQLTGSDSGYILSNWTAVTWTTNLAGWSFTTSGNAIYFSTYNGTSTSVSLGTGAGVPALDRSGWRHIVFTRTGTTYKIWLDGGTYTATSTSMLSPQYAGTIIPKIGRLGDSTMGGWDAYNSDKIDIDEVNVWKDKALTSTEVTELYNAGIGKFYPY